MCDAWGNATQKLGFKFPYGFLRSRALNPRLESRVPLSKIYRCRWPPGLHPRGSQLRYQCEINKIPNRRVSVNAGATTIHEM